MGWNWPVHYTSFFVWKGKHCLTVGIWVGQCSGHSRNWRL